MNNYTWHDIYEAGRWWALGLLIGLVLLVTTGVMLSTAWPYVWTW